MEPPLSRCNLNVNLNSLAPGTGVKVQNRTTHLQNSLQNVFRNLYHSDATEFSLHRVSKTILVDVHVPESLLLCNVLLLFVILLVALNISKGDAILPCKWMHLKHSQPFKILSCGA